MNLDLVAPVQRRSDRSYVQPGRHDALQLHEQLGQGEAAARNQAVEECRLAGDLAVLRLVQQRDSSRALAVQLVNLALDQCHLPPGAAALVPGMKGVPAEPDGKQGKQHRPRPPGLQELPDIPVRPSREIDVESHPIPSAEKCSGHTGKFRHVLRFLWNPQRNHLLNRQPRVLFERRGKTREVG